jgi:hypothetical protein
MKNQDWIFKGTKHWRAMRECLGWEPVTGYACYMIGALLFNINTGLAYADLHEKTETWVVWLSAFLGSILFTAGGLFECTHNHVFSKFDCGSPTHWLSILNFIGGVFFLIAGTTGLIGYENPDVGLWLIDFTYLVGSAAFLFGSLCALHLWKT